MRVRVERLTLVLKPLSLYITVRLFVLSPMLKEFENVCEDGLQAHARTYGRTHRGDEGATEEVGREIGR